MRGSNPVVANQVCVCVCVCVSTFKSLPTSCIRVLTRVKVKSNNEDVTVDSQQRF